MWPAPGKGESLGNEIDGLNQFIIFDYPTKGLSNSADVIPPSVYLISPENNTEFTTDDVVFNFTASDNSALILNCSFYSDIINNTFKLLTSQTINNGSMENFYANDIDDKTYSWQIACSDGLNIGISEIRTFSVDEPDAPVLFPIANITINETDIARIIINATDADNDLLVYSINNVNNTNFTKTSENTFEWQTSYDDAGVYYVGVSVNDESLSDSEIVKVTILNKNRKPVLNDIPSQTPDEDTQKTVQLDASDEDNNALIFRVKSEDIHKVNCEINESNLILIPFLNFNGNSTCVIEVSDGLLTDEKNVLIEILPVNDAPVLNSIADITVQETETARIIVNATDVDNNVSDLIFLTNDTRFIQDNVEKNIFTWETNYGDNGEYYVNVSVSDNISVTSKIARIIVTDKNEPPYLQAILDIEINEDSGFTDNIKLNATDNDGIISRFEVSKEDLSKVDCTVSDSLLGFQPAKDFFGNVSCTIRVYDDKNAWDEKIVNITVTGVNDAPEIISATPIFNPVIPENGNQIFSANWKDVDNSQADVKAEWFVNDVLSGIGNTYNYTGNEANIRVKISDFESFTTYEWNVSTSNIPIASNYNGNTTEFSQVSDLTNVNLILEKVDFGRIEFLEPVDLTNQIDFNHYSGIDSGLAGIDTGYFLKLAGKLAKITLYNLGFDKTPVIYYNSGFTLNKSEISSICPADRCFNVSYVNNTLDFISSFSSFKIGNTLTCSQQSGSICSEKENCQGAWINAVESRCCSQSCIEIPPEFNDADSCRNLNESIELEIKEPDSGDEFSIGENINIKVKIKNTGEDDDFDIKAYLYDLDDDNSIKEARKSISLDEDEHENVNFELVVPENADENNEHAIFVYAESDEGLCSQGYIDIDLKRESKVIIKNIAASPEELVCGENFDLSFDLKNLGENSEDIEVSVENKELGIKQTKNIELEEYGEEDEDKEIFTIKIPEDINASDYIFKIIADYSDETIEEKTISVYDCQKQEIKRVYLEREAVQSYKENAVKDNISTINILLIVSIILMIIAIILVIILRKR